MEVNKVPNSQHPVTPAVQTGLPPVVEVSETPNPERPVTPTVQTGLPPAMEVSQVPNPQRPVASSTPRPAPATQTTTQTTTQSQGGGAVPSSNVLSHGRVASLFAHSRSILPPTKSGSSSKINTPVRPVRSPPKRPRFGPSNMSLRKENKSEASKTLPSTKKPVSSDTNRPPGMLTPLNSSLAITPPDPKSTGTPGTGAAETVESTGTAADLTANATKPQNSAQGPMTPSSAPRPQAPKSRPRLLFPMISPSSKEMTATTPSSQAPRSVVRRPNIWGKPEPAKRPKETATQPLTFPQPPAATTTTTTTTPSAQAPKPVAPRTNIRDTPETIKRLWTDMMGDAEPVKRPRATAPQPFTFPQRPASTTTPAGWGGVEPWGAGLFPYHGAPRWS
ncbi:hypothetical protein F4780DRAFT_718066 [Xylariomycetidae sp. FL0641]|nr:hypothetical protein F4780DRAFT_718066 [Xylariomycetidae sp. FL0641]